jgi:hypothetical protein
MFGSTNRNLKAAFLMAWQRFNNATKDNLLMIPATPYDPLPGRFWNAASILDPAFHSWRKAVNGSTREARRAGSQQAARATTVKSEATIANVNGSVPLTP